MSKNKVLIRELYILVGQVTFSCFLSTTISMHFLTETKVPQPVYPNYFNTFRNEALIMTLKCQSHASHHRGTSPESLTQIKPGSENAEPRICFKSKSETLDAHLDLRHSYLTVLCTGASSLFQEVHGSNGLFANPRKNFQDPASRQQ